MQAIVGFPDKLQVKVPNYLNVDEGHVKSPTMVALLGLLLKAFGLYPKQHDKENSEVRGDLVWGLIFAWIKRVPLRCLSIFPHGFGHTIQHVAVPLFPPDHIKMATAIHVLDLLNLILELRGRLKRSARAVQLFGRLAVLETHTLRY